MADWTEKHRPETLDEVRGNDKAVGQLREWAETWDEHRQALLLHGPPGIGKTSAVYALATEMGWDTIELNASDQRTADEIERYAGRGAKNSTIEGAMQRAKRKQEGNERENETEGRQLIVIDEADNFHGNADRGGTAAVTQIVKEAGQPIVLIANEFYDMSNTLRNACETVEFAMQKRSIVPALRHICREEGIAFETEALERIAERNPKDLRGAVNDLQAVAEGREELTVEDVVTGERDRTRGIFDYLDTLIKEADAQEALEAAYDVDETPDDLVAWIEDNVPKDYRGEELALAYRALADADRWLGRVRETQNYQFWRYATDAMTAGVAAARREPKGGWTRYSPPSYWSKLGRSRGRRDTRDYVAREIAEHGGVSMGTARREVLPFLAAMTHHCTNRELTVAMAARYELDAEHVAFVTGSGEDTNKVQSIVEDARELRERAAVEHSGGAFDGRASGDVAPASEEPGDETEDATDPAGAGTLADYGTTADDEPTDGEPTDLGDTDEEGEAATGDEETEEPKAERDEADDQQSGLGDFT